MAKDFAKNTRKRNSASRFNKKKASKSIPGWFWLIAGLLIGILVSFVIDLRVIMPESTPVSVEKKPAASGKSRYQAVPAEEISDSDFSFHNALENKVVEIPEHESEPVKPGAATKRYIMQCGSFKKETSAETLKAQIAMNGFDARVNTSKEKNGSLWYRVTLGPYTSKRTAERVRHQLERNNINHCRIW